MKYGRHGELSRQRGKPIKRTLKKESPIFEKQMSGQESRGSVGEYQVDEQAGVARLSWRVSGR